MSVLWKSEGKSTGVFVKECYFTFFLEILMVMKKCWIIIDFDWIDGCRGFLTKKNFIASKLMNNKSKNSIQNLTLVVRYF